MSENSQKESAAIVRLKIKNFLSIADVEISPGQVNQIVGRNNQGKTTVLKAIEFAVKGSADPSLVKLGEDGAEVVVELADNTSIRRRLSASGKQSIDVLRNGFKAPSPQTYLDAIFDRSAFNPLDLLDPKKRHDAIMNSIELKVTPELLSKELGVEIDRLPPLEYDQHGLKVLEQAHKFFYQRRAEANKDALEKRNRYQTYKSDIEKSPVEKPVVSEIPYKETIDAANAEIADAKSKLEKIDWMQAQRKKDLDRVDKIKSTLAELVQQAALLNTRISDGERALREAEQSVANQESIPKRDDLLEVISFAQNKIAKADLEKSAFNNYQTYRKQFEFVEQLDKDAIAAESFAEALTKRVEALAGPIKKKVMSEAEMPIQGLEYRDGKFLVEDVPVDNLSSSKAIQLAIGVARKLSKKTKLICIDGAEALDADSYKVLRKEIDGDGYTYFLSKVGEPFEADDKVITMSGGKSL